jgi:hypothetical protein
MTLGSLETLRPKPGERLLSASQGPTIFYYSTSLHGIDKILCVASFGLETIMEILSLHFRRKKTRNRKNNYEKIENNNGNEKILSETKIEMIYSNGTETKIEMIYSNVIDGSIYSIHSLFYRYLLFELNLTILLFKIKLFIKI